MNKAEKVISCLIAVIIIIVIAIVIILNNINNREIEEDLQEESIGDEGEVIDYETETTKSVTDYIKFYTVKACVNTYLETINMSNSLYYGTDDEGNYSKTVDDEDIQQYIYNLLSDEYISENDITTSNVEDFVEELDQSVLFVPLKMNVLVAEDVEKYAVYGFITDLEYNYLKDIYLIVNLNVNGDAFSIEPIEDGKYSSIDEIELVNENIAVTENDENVVTEPKISYEYLSREYINAIKRIMLAKPELAYEYLDEKYREEKFDSYSEFTEYIEENYDNIFSLSLASYQVNEYEDYREYILVDTKGNYYTIEEEEIMDYTFMLDDYTILSDKFIESYNSATDEEKVQTDIETFFKMINTCDYKAAYNVLNDTFKQNNFSTLDDFVEYAKENFFDNTTITGVESISQSGTYYVCTFSTASSSDEDSTDVESDSETFIVSLGSGTDFELSFTVK